MIEPLHLPRVLCLHGGGTNARIFRMQCRALERALRSSLRFVYVEAPFETTPGPDVTSVYKQCGPFKAWLHIHPHERFTTDNHVMVESINTAIARAAQKDDSLGASGEWIGLLGFSQGAKLAASILHAQERGQINTRFQFALLLAGRGPLVSLDPDTLPIRGLASALLPTLAPSRSDIGPEHLLRTPTIHVHGSKDPNIELHRRLMYQYCEVPSTTLIEWDGGHRVPIAPECVNAIASQLLGALRDL